MAQKTVNKDKLLRKSFRSKFDVNGSYTGVDSSDRYEKPVQDADDL